MKSRAWLAFLLLLVGCTWSNSLYRARELSGSARKAEREDRTFEAGALWGRVAVKAESAWSRDPEGEKGAEALWLRGLALARLGQCSEGTPLIEAARFADIEADWRPAAALEVGRCRSISESPAEALNALLPLTESDDEDVADEARRIAGVATLAAGNYQQSLDLLEGFTSAPLRRARAEAFVGLGRTDEALAEIDAIFEDGDSVAIGAIDWRRLVRLVASRDVEDADTLISRIGRMPAVGDTSRIALQLLAAEGLLATDREQSVRRFYQIAQSPPSPTVYNARTRYIEARLQGVRTPMELKRVLDSISQLVGAGGGVASVAGRAIAMGGELLADVDQIAPGTPQGDMAFFMRAEIARDSLEAPLLAAELFNRIPAGWPDSPYLVKALLALIPLQPGRAAELRALVELHPESAYRAQALGQASPDYSRLEDSLGNYIADRMFAEAEARQLLPVTDEF